jgi:F-type H+-transporting ATPase subunit b
MELLDKLGIDWRLLIGQLINFFVLLFILWKLLYKPLVGMLEKRSKKIAKSLEDAEAITLRLREVEEEVKTQIAKARGEAQILLEEAKKGGETLKKEILAEAKEKSLQIVEDGKKQLLDEKESMVRIARVEIGGLILTALDQILGKGIPNELDSKLIEKAIKEVQREHEA